jgi:hypothetical protein
MRATPLHFSQSRLRLISKLLNSNSLNPDVSICVSACSNGAAVAAPTPPPPTKFNDVSKDSLQPGVFPHSVPNGPKSRFCWSTGAEATLYSYSEGIDSSLRRDIGYSDWWFPCIFFSILTDKIWGSTTIASFHILFNSSFIHHPTIRRYRVWVLTAL